MTAHLFAAETAPFTVALGLMVLIAALEGIGLIFGLALSGVVDSLLPDFDVPEIDVEIDPGANGLEPGADLGTLPEAGLVTQFLGWLSFGRVPALILLIVFLTAFGLAGLAIQGGLYGLTGFYLPAILATIPAFAAALPSTRYVGLGLARIMPKEETEAVSHSEFVGKVATIVLGTSRRGEPAQAKLRDKFGQSHYVMVEPDHDDDEFHAGKEILIVRQAGAQFRAIANTSAALSPANPN